MLGISLACKWMDLRPRPYDRGGERSYASRNKRLSCNGHVSPRPEAATRPLCGQRHTSIEDGGTNGANEAAPTPLLGICGMCVGLMAMASSAHWRRERHLGPRGSFSSPSARARSACHYVSEAPRWALPASACGSSSLCPSCPASRPASS